MSRVNSIDITGFKGIESMGLEFENINIITGKNNTGKTSVLEAIDISLNPTHIRGYPQPLNHLINIEKKEVKIDCVIDGSTNKFVFREASRSEALESYRKFIRNLFESQLNNNVLGIRIPHQQEEVGEEVLETLKEEAVQFIGSAPSDFKQRVASNTYTIHYNEADHVYLNLSKFHDRFLNVFMDEKGEEVADEIQDDVNSSEGANIATNDLIFHYLHGGIGHPSGGGFNSVPEGKNKTAFIRSGTLEHEPEDSEGEDAAVKKTQIRDYLEDHNIVEGLVDFDFDEMVIEGENGERKPISYEYQGDGFKSIVGILWRLLDQDSKGNDAVLLEEPENHMHPGYIGELVPFLIDTASKDQRQLFITTHNVDLISTFLSSELSDERIEYLKDNFQVIQMGEQYNRVLDYPRAKKDLDDLHDDLRGI